MTFSSGPISLNPPMGGLPPFILSPARSTTWKPGVTYNVFPNTGLVGIPNRTALSTNSPFSPLDVAPGRQINITIASPAIITMVGGGVHGMVGGDAFFLYTTGALPTGVSGLASSAYLTAANTLYYVLNDVNFSTTQFAFSLSAGGTAVNSTGSQSGTQTMIREDGARIANEFNNVATAEQVVKLNAGIFNIGINGIRLVKNNITLRGAGPGVGLNTAINPISQTTTWIPGTMVADTLATQLYRVDRNIGAGAFRTIGIDGGNAVSINSTVNLTADAVKGTFSCQIASVPGDLAVGSLVLIDINTSGTQGGDVRDCNLGIANPGAIHQNSHGLAAGTSFQLKNTSIDGTYFVLAGGVSDTVNSFQFSTTVGGSPVNTLGVTFTKIPQIVVTGSFFTTIPPNPDVDWGINMGPPTNSTRATWQNISDRSIGQMMKVAVISGTTITFETPFHYPMQTKYVAQLHTFGGGANFTNGIGVEELFCYGATGGGITIGLSQYCWVKHCECAWTSGAGVQITSSYRCECRDSYIHEAPTPHPNSSAYLVSIVTHSSDCLFENNITWYGDKVITMQASGGGNVLGYNYMDDAFIDTLPYSPEAGINCGHNTTTPFTLMEGNYSHKFTGDSFWGGSIFTTCLRNQFSAHRAAAHNLATYIYTPQSTHYGDWANREAVNLFAGSINTNFVGNILGMQGQTLLAADGSGLTSTQTAFVYEQFNAAHTDSTQVIMWQVGQVQGTALLPGENPNLEDPTLITSVLRQGNWDWFTASQHWYLNIGDTGASTGSVLSLPNSYYLTNKPSFLGNHPWPSGDPSTGTFANQAQARFNTSNPNDLTA